MNQIIVIALGGAFGAVARFLVSSGIYQWLGRDFPYGTLVVNVVGSFLMGLLTEALILQRVSIGMEYRAAILVGFIGALTTFSTFSLDTFYLLEQGNSGKALLNIALNVVACLLAIWLGLVCAKALFNGGNAGIWHWRSLVIPYGLLTVNVLGAFIMGIIATVLLQKVVMPMEHKAALLVLLLSVYLTLSGLYLILFFIEQGYEFNNHIKAMLGVFVGNGVLCFAFISLAFFLIRTV